MSETEPAPLSALPVAPSIDPAEIARFTALAAQWWDPTGKFRPLHKFNPIRLDYIRNAVCRHFARSPRSLTPFEDLSVLDIGCGGGLLSEPMARLGAQVTGVDAGEKNIKTAMIHAESQGLAIDYRTGSAEALAASGARFDIILNMEVVEHVTDIKEFISVCASMIKPGGLMFCATLNRTAKAYALAIIGAEYLLRWLERGTHDWSKFVTPGELTTTLEQAGLTPTDTSGVIYEPLADRFRLTSDLSVNYMILAEKPA